MCSADGTIQVAYARVRATFPPGFRLAFRRTCAGLPPEIRRFSAGIAGEAGKGLQTPSSTMSRNEEVKVLQACTTPRFMSQIIPLTGLRERRLRGLLQSLKSRGLARLLHRRWATTRAGERYAQRILAEIETEEREAEERRRRIEQLAAALRGRLVEVQGQVQAAVSECKEIPLAEPQMQRLEPELERLRSFQRQLAMARDETSLRKLERVLNARLPRVAALAQEAGAQVASLGLFEVVRKRQQVDDPVWLRCTACRQLQPEYRQVDNRHECVKCHRRGRVFVSAQKSTQDYVAPPSDQGAEMDSREWLLRRLRTALEAHRMPSPVAGWILTSVEKTTMSPHAVHFACRMRMGETATRMTVAYVFQIPRDYPYPWPITA